MFNATVGLTLDLVFIVIRVQLLVWRVHITPRADKATSSLLTTVLVLGVVGGSEAGATVGVAEAEPLPSPVVHHYRSVGEGRSLETHNILIDSSHVVDILSSITTERAGTQSNHSDKEKSI